MNEIEIKFKISGSKENQKALLEYLCNNFVTDDSGMTSGEIRSLLYKAMDLAN